MQPAQSQKTDSRYVKSFKRHYTRVALPLLFSYVVFGLALGIWIVFIVGMMMLSGTSIG